MHILKYLQTAEVLVSNHTLGYIFEKMDNKLIKPLLTVKSLMWRNTGQRNLRII